MCLLEQWDGLASDAWWERIVECDGRLRDTRGDDNVNPGLAQAMYQSLPKGQVEDGAIQVRHRQPSFGKDAPEVRDSGCLNLGAEAELPREAFEFVDVRPRLLQVRFCFEGSLILKRSERSQYHSQASQGTGVRLFLSVKWQLDTHSTVESLPGRRQSAAPVLSGRLLE
jgi:hypothetical protein